MIVHNCKPERYIVLYVISEEPALRNKDILYVESCVFHHSHHNWCRDQDRRLTGRGKSGEIGLVIFVGTWSLRLRKTDAKHREKQYVLDIRWIRVSVVRRRTRKVPSALLFGQIWILLHLHRCRRGDTVWGCAEHGLEAK